MDTPQELSPEDKERAYKAAVTAAIEVLGTAFDEALPKIKFPVPMPPNACTAALVHAIMTLGAAAGQERGMPLHVLKYVLEEVASMAATMYQESPVPAPPAEPLVKLT